MPTLLLRTYPPDDATEATPAGGFVDCRGEWQTLELAEPVDAGS